MKKQTSSYALLIAPLMLFILALAVLCFEYECRLSVHMATQLQLIDTTSRLKKEVRELNYMLDMLGGAACAMRLKGLRLQIENLSLDLEEAYTNVAYCDDMDESVMGLRMEVLELESELGRL